MATFPQDLNADDLSRIAERAFRSSGRAYEKYIQSNNPNLQLEMSPVAEMASSSPITGALKRILPNKVKDTEIGRLIASVLPEDLKRGLGNVELGGMSAEEKQLFSQLVLILIFLIQMQH